jgi:hypothetical protein
MDDGKILPVKSDAVFHLFFAAVSLEAAPQKNKKAGSLEPVFCVII